MVRGGAVIVFLFAVCNQFMDHFSSPKEEQLFMGLGKGEFSGCGICLGKDLEEFFCLIIDKPCSTVQCRTGIAGSVATRHLPEAIPDLYSGYFPSSLQMKNPYLHLSSPEKF